MKYNFLQISCVNSNSLPILSVSFRLHGEKINFTGINFIKTKYNNRICNITEQKQDRKIDYHQM